jgi:hypothetical protein
LKSSCRRGVLLQGDPFSGRKPEKNVEMLRVKDSNKGNGFLEAFPTFIPALLPQVGEDPQRGTAEGFRNILEKQRIIVRVPLISFGMNPASSSPDQWVFSGVGSAERRSHAGNQ